VRRAARLLAAGILALAALPLQALACGACIEDKVAVTYDHAVVTEAAARRHVVVFAAVDGAGADAARSAQAAARVSGVTRGSVRSAASPAALSFALDPKVQTPEAALAAIARRMGAPAAHLTLIRVMR